jgi:hypothetical protein
MKIPMRLTICGVSEDESGRTLTFIVSSSSVACSSFPLEKPPLSLFAAAAALPFHHISSAAAVPSVHRSVNSVQPATDGGWLVQRSWSRHGQHIS